MQKHIGQHSFSTVHYPSPSIFWGPVYGLPG